MRWTCPTCGVYFDFLHTPDVNRLDSGTEAEIDACAVALKDWWTQFCHRSGENRSFALPLFREKREEVPLDGRWRLGFIASLSPQPKQWTFMESPAPTHVAYPVRVRPWVESTLDTAPPPELNRVALKSIRRAIFSRHLRSHRRCLGELTGLGAFERSALVFRSVVN